MNQQQHDARSLAWHRYVVERMCIDPALLDKARAILARWQAIGSRPNRGYLAECQAALDAGFDAVERLATDESERCNALRQCSVSEASRPLLPGRGEQVSMCPYARQWTYP